MSSKIGSSDPNTVELVFFTTDWATGHRKLGSAAVFSSTRSKIFLIFFVAPDKGVWPPKNYYQRCSAANGTNNLPKDNQLANCIAKVAVDHAHSFTLKVFLAPRPQKHPCVRPAFFKLKANLLMCFHPVRGTSQNTRKHSIDNDWLKQMKDQ